MQEQMLKIEFGEMVQKKRSELNITQNQLADRANISCTYLREIEHGMHTPTWINWLRLCSELEIDPKNFISKMK